MATPYGLVAAAERVRPARKTELLEVTRTLEERALADPPLQVAAALQDCRFVSERTRDVYARLAAAGTRATLLAHGLTAWVAPGVAGVPLDEDDPLVHEWVMVVPGTATPVVFAATDLDRPCDDDLDRSFSYAVSEDPELVEACALLLLGTARHQGPWDVAQPSRPPTTHES